MSIQKFQVKLYVENPDALDLDRVIPVFHAFIREKKIPDLLIDVADYGHVVDGPGVVLIGHASDYYVEQREGRAGLLYSRKRAFEGSTEAALLAALTSALGAASVLEREPSLGISFGLGEVQVRVNDRLAAKNDDESFETLRETIANVLGKALGSGIALSRDGDSRDLLTVRARGGKGSVREALARIS